MILYYTLTMQTGVSYSGNDVLLAKEVLRLFHSTRWKAYLEKIQEGAKNNINQEIDTVSSLFHELHTQNSTLFDKWEDNGYQKAAEEHLKRSGELLKDCTRRVDALEEILANTPKPSEMLNWDKMTLGDLTGGQA